ncbi:GHMP kinase [Verrucomicrobia bacterium S94]|nr:GHMP kinase [Verrucomicrobia bacterium S94]
MKCRAQSAKSMAIAYRPFGGSAGNPNCLIRMAEAAVIKTSAPGSLMLLGEHAVLHGNRALIGAIDRRIQVELFPIPENVLEIDSGLGTYRASLSDLKDDPRFRFVLQAVRRHLDAVPSGLFLKIHSEFSADIGFGSSAAVTVATHAALMFWLSGNTPAPERLFDEALKTVQTVQGRGSGSDLAASVFGGIVGYTIDPDFIPLNVSIPLTAVYCGYKTPTPDVILRVEQLKADDPGKYMRIYAEMHAGRKRRFPGCGITMSRVLEKFSTGIRN